MRRRRSVAVRNLSVLFLILSLAAGPMMSASTAAAAAPADPTAQAEVLNQLSIVRGDGTNFNLDGKLRRSEAVTLTIRLMGQEPLVLGKTAAYSATATAFSDVSADQWYAPYIGYCREQGIVGGFDDGTFRPDEYVSEKAFLKLTLGALGYRYGQDFAWADVYRKALDVGLVTDGQYGTKDQDNTAYKRQGAFGALFNSLDKKVVGQGTVADRLVKQGATTGEAVAAVQTRTGKSMLTPPATASAGGASAGGASPGGAPSGGAPVAGGSNPSWSDLLQGLFGGGGTSTTGTATDAAPVPLTDEYKAVLAGPEYRQPAGVTKKVTSGHTFMDYYSNTMYRDFADTTLDAMKTDGASWVVFDNYWSYQAMDQPVIAPFPATYRLDGNSFHDANEAELADLIQKAHARGLKFALMLAVNWDLLKGPFTDAATGAKIQADARALLVQKGAELENPTAATNSYWDRWFATYQQFLLWHAQVAQKYGADMLVIGQQIEGAVRQGNTARWQALIAETRKVYSGPLAYAGWTDNSYSELQDAGFAKDLDYLIDYMYNDISDQANPSIADLKASFEQIFDSQAEKFAREYGKKVILLTPFQSRDYGAKQEWFEPAEPAPTVQQDLLIQAKLYEAFYQALEDEDWAEAVWTWGYWWMNSFNRPGRTASFEKSSTVRNKPAAEIIRKWSK